MQTESEIKTNCSTSQIMVGSEKYRKNTQSCNHLEEGEKVDCFAIISYRCIVTINVLWPFLTVSWADLQCVIVAFPDHTQSLFGESAI